MAIEGVQGTGAQRVGFHEDISKQIFADVTPRTRTADAKAAAQTAQTEEQAATQKTDEVNTTEPSAKAKMDPAKIDDIIKSMQESVSKLSDISDADRATIDKELSGLQEQLQKFVGGYNDALKYAQSSSNSTALSYAAMMTTRTAANQDPWQQLGFNVNDDNTFSQIESIASMKDNNEAISAMKDLFNGNYSYAAKTMESVQGIFGA